MEDIGNAEPVHLCFQRWQTIPIFENCPPSPMKIVCGSRWIVRGDSAESIEAPILPVLVTSAHSFRDAELLSFFSLCGCAFNACNSACGRCNGQCRRRQIPAPTTISTNGHRQVAGIEKPRLPDIRYKGARILGEIRRRILKPYHPRRLASTCSQLPVACWPGDHLSGEKSREPPRVALRQASNLLNTIVPSRVDAVAVTSQHLPQDAVDTRSVLPYVLFANYFRRCSYPARHLLFPSKFIERSQIWLVLFGDIDDCELPEVLGIPIQSHARDSPFIAVSFQRRDDCFDHRIAGVYTILVQEHSPGRSACDGIRLEFPEELGWSVPIGWIHRKRRSHGCRRGNQKQDMNRIISPWDFRLYDCGQSIKLFSYPLDFKPSASFSPPNSLPAA